MQFHIFSLKYVCGSDCSNIIGCLAPVDRFRYTDDLKAPFILFLFLVTITNNCFSVLCKTYDLAVIKNNLLTTVNANKYYIEPKRVSTKYQLFFANEQAFDFLSETNNLTVS